jgi:hypothetical protein
MAEEEWISAVEALKRVLAASDRYSATRAICARAYAGLIKTKATRFVDNGEVFDDFEIPTNFWWARGEAALTQDWRAGDFQTWIGRKHHLEAFGVAFSRNGIETLVAPAMAILGAPAPSKVRPGGRPRAEWWDDLWVEMCRKLWNGDLKPKRQSDIESAMLEWASAHGHNPAVSTMRGRAQKLWKALNEGAEN